MIRWFGLIRRSANGRW